MRPMLWLLASALGGAMSAVGAAPMARADGPERGTGAGQLHPDPWLRDVEGAWRQLSSYGGAKLLLFHFASW